MKKRDGLTHASEYSTMHTTEIALIDSFLLRMVKRLLYCFV